MRTRTERLRARHPVPLTWEVPTLVCLIGALAVACAPLAAQGMVAWASGEGFLWPRGHEVDAVLGLLGGDWGVGLRADRRSALPPASVLWGAALLGEVLVTAAMTVFSWAVRNAAGNVSGHGLATRGQARRALGARALRRQGRQLRPDLQPTRGLVGGWVGGTCRRAVDNRRQGRSQ